MENTPDKVFIKQEIIEEGHPEQKVVLSSGEHATYSNYPKDVEVFSDYSVDYQCPHCPNNFESLAILELHSYVHREGADCPQECPVCHYTFSQCVGPRMSQTKRKKYIASHINIHVKEKIKEYNIEKYTCPFCNKVQSKRYQFMTHLRVHTNEKPFNCNLCDKAFKQKGSLQSHMDSFHNNISYKCGFCETSFTTQSSRKKHIRNIHEEIKQENVKSDKAEGIDLEAFSIDSKISCTVCPSTFDTKEQLQIHEHWHNLGKRVPSRCPVYGCFLRSQKKSEFRAHINYHVKENMKGNSKLHTCNVCSKSFKYLAKLKQHNMDFHDDKGIRCKICLGSFVNLNGLKRHISKVHDNGLKINCHYCKKYFTDKAALMDHIEEKHNRSFTLRKCRYCAKVFHGSSMQKHLTKHRREGIVPKLMRQCSMCEAKFQNQETYTQHMNDHLGYNKDEIGKAVKENYFPCKLCPKISRKRWHLLTHMARHMKRNYSCRFCENSYSYFGLQKHNCNKCKMCDKGFTGKGEKKEHMLRYHIARLKRRTGNGENNCSKCGKLLGSYKLLSSSERCACVCLNSGNLNRCKVCKKSFDNHKGLKKHYLAHLCNSEYNHNPLKNTYFCIICKKSIKSYLRLCVHLYKHKNPKKYKCATCYKFFLTKNQRDVHRRSRICINFLASVRTKEYHCFLCSKQFFTKKHLNNHLMYHTINYKKCRFCNSKFKGFTFIRDHIKKEHPGQKVAYCRYCDLGFDKYENMKLHMFNKNHLMRSYLKMNRMIDSENLNIVGIKQEYFETNEEVELVH